MIDDPVLTVLLYSAAAAATAVLGVLPHALGVRLALPIFGWANALAAGLMLGVAYVLLTAGLQDGMLAGGLGAVLGIGFVRITHAITGTGELDLADLQGAGPGHSRKIFLAETLHAAHEGIAIGAAMTLSLPLGIAMAVTLGFHNIPEAMVLTRALIERGVTVYRIAGLAVASNVNQVLLAVGTYVALAAVPSLIPWVTGFAVGAFLYLVLVELLPESYRQAGHTSIAVVTLVAMGMVVLLTGTR